MPSLAVYGSLLCNQPTGRTGDTGYRPNVEAVGYPFLRTGVSVLTYQVPDRTKAVLGSLTLWASANALSALNAQATILNAGLVEFLVDGTNKWEQRLVAPYFTGAGTFSQPLHPAFAQPPHFGNGIDFTSGQVLTVRLTPTAGTDGIVPVNYRATLWGLDPVSGATLIQDATVYPRSTALDATINVLAYSVPANGFRMLGWMVDVNQSDVVLGNMNVYLDDVCVLETGYITQTSHRGEPKPVIVLPLDGIELEALSTVRVTAMPWLDLGQRFSALLVGQTFPEKARAPINGGLVRR